MSNCQCHLNDENKNLKEETPRPYFVKNDKMTYLSDIEDDIFDDKHECCEDIVDDSEYLQKIIDKGYHLIYVIRTVIRGCTDDDYLCVEGKYNGRKISFAFGGNAIYFH